MNKLVLHSTLQESSAAKVLVSADAQLNQQLLVLRYRIELAAGVPKVVWPALVAPKSVLTDDLRKVELWNTTCLEAFLFYADGTYIEFNFAPDGHWNAYSFTGYRAGMKADERISDVHGFQSSKSESASVSTYELTVTVDLSHAVKSPQHFRLGLTSVIETEGGERSYWSLKHPGEKPDFHDSRGYVLEMRI